MSIQLKLDGHSFSLTKGDVESVAADAEQVNILVLTEKSMLIPAEVFDPTTATQMLAMNGMACTDDQTAVVGACRDDKIALVMMQRSLYDDIRAHWGDRAHIYSPLTLDESAATRRNVVELYVESGVVYAKIYSERLIFADAFAVANDDDILYIMAKLNEHYAISTRELHIAGGDAERLSALLSKYFKVLCA